MPHDRCFIQNGDQLLGLVSRVTEGNAAGDSPFTRDQAGTLLDDPADDHFPLEFGKARHKIEHERIGRSFGQFRHRCHQKLYAEILEFVYQGGAICNTPRQSVEPMDDDCSYSTAANQHQHALECGTIQVRAGPAMIVEVLFENLKRFRLSKSHADLAPDITRREIAARLGRLASIDRAHGESAPIDLRQT